ncbi:peptidoglycan recognition protein family protein [Tepidibacter thalassicus]|uniref:N-acetylmuramoyl-L-alanine amidase n=1 Tax=Tepidibacter thalassicus DSM 15285 TaxID=1123350 RepID=A0A1M5PUM9_9FIRM|nr:peptidoglycan recognition family protein [Tepidibacter thalassicus]SHH05707.1 N-acetylmuramoyl-L-alanine amidase [Tepidibacter thalassicus DSM 15285]
MNKPNKIIIHHSLTKDGKTVSWNAIRKYHKSKGWRDIGYHWGIELVGDEYEILKGRDENEVGAHTKGQNSSSIGICLVGNFDIDEPSKAQLYKLIELIRNIWCRYGQLPVYMHNQFASYKTCPGKKFPYNWLLNELKRESRVVDDDFKIAINKLAEKGVINSPAYWINNDDYKTEYVRELIKKVSRKLG